MKSNTKFEKVSFEQFKEDWEILDTAVSRLSDEEIKTIYDNIKLPKRSSKHSAGYDFFLPIGLYFPATNKAVTIPTGIRCVDMADDEVLMIYPRSGLGIKKRLVVTQGTGVIDAR